MFWLYKRQNLQSNHFQNTRWAISNRGSCTSSPLLPPSLPANWFQSRESSREGRYMEGDCKYMELLLVPSVCLQLLPLSLSAALRDRCSELHLWAWKATDTLNLFSICDPLRVTPWHTPMGFHRVLEPWHVSVSHYIKNIPKLTFIYVLKVNYLFHPCS